mmetsp:Transcript_44303/g.79676  ORF Transcript_44303/g.79676 Transcript_44303/m.79676 type:complete len:238 (+) Transcript_44303:2864-3577(+)
MQPCVCRKHPVDDEIRDVDKTRRDLKRSRHGQLVDSPGVAVFESLHGTPHLPTSLISNVQPLPICFVALQMPFLGWTEACRWVHPEVDGKELVWTHLLWRSCIELILCVSHDDAYCAHITCSRSIQLHASVSDEAVSFRKTPGVRRLRHVLRIILLQDALCRPVSFDELLSGSGVEAEVHRSGDLQLAIRLDAVHSPDGDFHRDGHILPSTVALAHVATWPRVLGKGVQINLWELPE